MESRRHNRRNSSKRIVYAIRSNRLASALLGDPAVIRGSISTAIALSLVLFGMIGFLSMLGPPPGSHNWLWIGQSDFSDSHISQRIEQHGFGLDSKCPEPEEREHI
jgi:hypothetical protein